MREYICQKCREMRYSAGTSLPCPTCGGVLKETGEPDEYRKRRDELMQQGFSLEEAIRKINGKLGR